MLKYIFTGSILTSLFFTACNNGQNKQNQTSETASTKADTTKKIDSVVYKSENLVIRKISDHIYEHTSFLNSPDFGKVSCNGMIVDNGNEAVIFDTTTDDKSSGELINFVTEKLQSKIKGIIPAHFHEDCVGGLEKFNEQNIPVFASNKTIAFLKAKNRKFSKPITGFDDSLALNVGNKKVYAQYFGEGHTKDNIVGYFPDDKAVFGGCLIKEVGATKGNLEDANTKDWPATVEKLKGKYTETAIVIPGHGKSGGPELFDYTIKLFK